MKILTAVVASIALAACGGAKPKTSSAAATLAPGEPNGCAGACDRVAQCWQLQYGQADAEGDRAACETTCQAKPADEQAAYAQAMAAETSCPAILDM